MTTWFRVRSCFSWGKTVQKKTSREGVLQWREWKSQNPTSQVLRKSWDQKLSIRVKSLGQAVDVGTMSQWHHICDILVTRVRKLCNNRIWLSPAQSRGQGCPLPATGSLRSARSLDGKPMKLLLPLMCPPWSVPPPAVEDGTHPEGRVSCQFHPKGSWQV